MADKRKWAYWLKILGLFVTATQLGRLTAIISRGIGYFFKETLLGVTLLYGSLPLALLVFALWPADYTPPIFDVQVHYNEESWQRVSPEAILNASEEINVPWLLVCSTPNEGTLRLYEANRDKIIPMLVPQFNREDRENWFNNADIMQYMERELARGIYRGIGEFFLFDGQTNTPVVRRMVELAARNDLILHARSDPNAIHQLFEMNANIRILWAHAGMFTPPETVSSMLDRYPRLWVEISHRGDIAPSGKLNDKWREVFLRHADRFLLGSGTYSSKYWYEFRTYMSRYRGWLKDLPKEVAERMAFRNGLVLFDLKHSTQVLESVSTPVKATSFWSFSL